MKIDIHVHSKYSKRPSQWILKKIGCPESFTEPLQIYRIAKNHGMSHVTITDHNSISGALEIAHLSDTFVSEEITTYFPDDGCKIHVLALNITEAQHAEIQRLRTNIFDLAQYLKQESILTIVAHPLYAINDRLRLAHFEQLLLCFQHFELNGARNQRENQCLRTVLSGLAKADIERLADKHDCKPLYTQAWKKCLWGGSDDHSSLNIARTYTCIDDACDAEVLRGVTQGFSTKVVNQDATPLTMAHNLYGIAYQFYRSKFHLSRYADKDVLMRFLDHSLRVDANRNPGLLAKLYLLWQYRKDKNSKAPLSDSLLQLLRHETRKVISEDTSLFTSQDNPQDGAVREKKWFDFVDRVSQRVMLHFGNHLLDQVSGAKLFNIFATIGSAGGLYTLLAPYFVAFSQFSKDRDFSDVIHRSFAAGDKTTREHNNDQLKVAHFTDTFYEVNGVALTLQQQVKLAIKNNKHYTLVTCHKEHREEQAGVKNFNPIGSYELPEYPEQKIFYPPLLEMLTFCYDQGFNHLHSATPGPIGLAALAIAKILKLPISGTYHTAIPQYVQILTGDSNIEDLAWKYVLWYYSQMDVVYAPSQSTCDELIEKGIEPDKIRVYPRGIDTEEFNPSHRNGLLEKWFNIHGGINLLYVGRVSKEKNIHLLGQAFEKLSRIRTDVRLVIVGDGPYLHAMQQAMEGLPCYFTGYVRDNKLSEIYAGADLFLFPSTTDTFGNVVLEAQASGLPVIVTDSGGPCENMIDGQTGFVVAADDSEALYEAMKSLIDNPDRMRRMGKAARHYMEQRSFEAAFLQTWKMYYQDTLQTSAKPAAASKMAI
ncbi:MAG: glycosyltransferase [Desulfobacteraceae bacterium]|jgi:glycosyltransferase involved in cell wall biosynthesis